MRLDVDEEGWFELNEQLTQSGERKSSSNKLRSYSLKALKYLLASVILYFVFRQIKTNWQPLTEYSWTVDWVLLIASVILHLGTFLIFSKVWCVLMSGLGYHVPLKYGFKIGYIANLGRYIPGKIWPVFGMAYLARQINIKEEVSVASWGIALMFALPSAFLAGLLCIIIHPEFRKLGDYVGNGFIVAAAALTVLSLLLVLVPNKALLAFNMMLKLIKRSPIRFSLSISVAIKVYVGYFICWLSYGFAFWVFIKSIVGTANVPVVVGVGVFVLAYQIGYLAVFSPAGLGVREIVITTMLATFLGPLAAGVAVAARMWNLVSEIIAAVVAWRIRITNEDNSDTPTKSLGSS